MVDRRVGFSRPSVVSHKLSAELLEPSKPSQSLSVTNYELARRNGVTIIEGTAVNAVFFIELKSNPRTL